MAENGTKNNFSYHRIVEIDDIDVSLIPEKKGLFIKHVEYIVTSRVMTILKV